MGENYEDYKKGDRKKITEFDIEKYTLKAKEEAKTRQIVLNPALFVPKEIDISKAKYEMDILQEEMLRFYLRADVRFRRAFHTNFTNMFFQFLIDKARLREPYHLSCMGQVRSGKSYAMITVTGFTNALYDRKMTIDYVSGNQYEFLQKVQRMPTDMLYSSAFQNDEDKGAIFSAGSVAKKMKLQDVQNIIAMNNISTITICPNKLSNPESFYGFRAFGRCTQTKTVRFMLYNMQENSNSHLPMGMVYIPIFTEVLPYADELEKAYLMKKKSWIEEEQRGEGDILFELKKRQALIFARNPKFRNIKHKKDKLTFIGLSLGSEWTSKECEEILSMTELISQGAIDEDEEEEEKVSPEEVTEAKEETKENELSEEETEEAEAEQEEEETEQAEKDWEEEKEDFEAK